MEHEFFWDIQDAYDTFMNDNDLSMFCTSIYESLVQYRIDNNIE